MAMPLRLMRFRRKENEDPPGLNWEVDGPWKSHNELSTRQSIQKDDTTYFCRTRNAREGNWRIAYGTPIGTGNSRVFLFDGDEVCWDRQVDHPIAGLVANDGTVLILEGGASDKLEGKIHVFDVSGSKRFEYSFDANVADVDMTPDGSFAVVQTQPNEKLTYLFNLRTGELVAEHSSDWAQPSVARVRSTDDGYVVYLSKNHNKRPFYALDETGTVVWESRRHRKMRPLLERLKARVRSR